MTLAFIVSALALATVYLVGSGFRPVDQPDPPAAPPCSPDCVPRSLLVRSEARSRKRLMLARKYEVQRNRLRVVLRAQRRQRGTGIPWLDDALCVHSYESRDWQQKGHHFGGMQFNVGTWASVGGRGNPADAHPMEQLYRAFLVWSRDGGSWREWSTAGMCGLR